MSHQSYRKSITTVVAQACVAVLCLTVLVVQTATARASDCVRGEGARAVTNCLAAGAARMPADSEPFDPSLALEFGGMDLDVPQGSFGPLPGVQVTWPSLAPIKAAPGHALFGTWSKLEQERGAEDTRTSSGAGLNIKPNRAATIEMKVESEESSVDAALSQQTKLAAIFNLAPSPLLSFEAKAAMTQQSVDVAGGDAQSAQHELSARLSGDWRFGGYKLMPNLSISRAATDAALPGIATGPMSTIVVAPTLSRPVKLDKTAAFEPFLTYKQELGIGPFHAGSALVTETRSAGGGIKLEKRDSYSLTVTTDIENLDAQRQSLRSQLRVSVPLR